MRLHNTVLEAHTDLHMHSSVHRAVTTNNRGDSSPSSSSGTAAAAAAAHSGLTRVQASRQQQHEGSIPHDAALLEDLDAAAAAGPVGGAKAAYVAAKLVSAAAWKHLGFESNPLQDAVFSPKSLPSHSAEGSISDVGAGRSYSGGEWMGEVLLSSGGFLPSHHSVIQLLGGSAGVLLPVVTDGTSVSYTAPDFVGSDSQTADNAQGSLSRVHSRQPGPDGRPGPAAEFVAAEQRQQVVISGWYPCLYHDVYQDVELA